MKYQWLLAGLTTLFVGCGSCMKNDTTAPAPIAPAAAPAAATSSTAPVAAPKVAGNCLIDNAEDNDNKTSMVAGRGGYWFTFADKAGSNITPSGNFSMTPGGANGSAYAARMFGKIGNGSPSFVGGGFNFLDPKSIYDASAYTGISFWAKVGPGSVSKVRFKVSDVETDPAGKICGQNGTDDGCYNDFGKVFDLTPEWKQYSIAFTDMKQGDGWGIPRPAAILPAKLYGIVWEVNDKGASYDIWVDDIQFTGCN